MAFHAEFISTKRLNIIPIRQFQCMEQYTLPHAILQAQNVGFAGFLPLFEHVLKHMVTLSSFVNQRLLIIVFFCIFERFFLIPFHSILISAKNPSAAR
jgi:hypothetical protein